MPLSSTRVAPFFSELDIRPRETSALSNEQHREPVPNHVRRHSFMAQGRDGNGAPGILSDHEVPAFFQSEVVKAKQSDHQAYEHGYVIPSTIDIPGYHNAMDEYDLMRLAEKGGLSPAQLGALQYYVERRVAERATITSAQQDVRRFTQIITAEGVRTTPTPQSYYLSIVNHLSKGECAGLVHLMSLAIEQGKEQILLGNIHQALANPDSPESQAFFLNLAKVHNEVTDPGVSHDPATAKIGAYTEIAAQLTSSPDSKTLLISAHKHRLSAGVIVEPSGHRTYYYFDPNIGLTKFNSAEAFEAGLKKIFTHPTLMYLVKPLQTELGRPMYKISVFKRDHLPQISGASNNVKFMYDAPLAGLDQVNVLRVSKLPTPAQLRLNAPPAGDAAATAYERVLQGLKEVHELKGMSQFHKALDVFETVERFIDDHPNASQVPTIKALGHQLLNAINQAAAPEAYPYIFERMERDRAYLAEERFGSPSYFKTELIQGKSVEVSAANGIDPHRVDEVKATIGSALQNLSKVNPAAVQSVGSIVSVVIANAGDPPQTQLRLSTPPTLIIGDDFFNAPPGQARDDMVAGRLQEVHRYMADPKAFLVAENARLSLLTDASKPAALTTRPFSADASQVDAAQLQRMEQLDKTRPAIRIGEVEVSRAELYKLGATVNGKPIEDALVNDPDGSKLAATVEIDYSRFAANLKSAPSEVAERMNSVLGELAANRNLDAPPMIKRRDGGPVPEALTKAVKEMSTVSAEMRDFRLGNKPVPPDFFSAGDTKTAGSSQVAGLGFRAFSTFQALRSAVENLREGDTTAAAIGFGAVGADYVGLGVEAGLNKMAQKAITGQAKSIIGFKAGSLGKMIGKAAGGVGLVFSVPFDTYNAVDSFKKADRSTGKEAQDHYVNGAFAVANAVTSTALGVAFMAGASAAGPAGLIVAGTLMAAQAIYSAVRSVENIDRYTPLSGVQKFSVGVKSFLGFDPGFNVMKPYLEEKYAKEYVEQNQNRHAAFLQGEGKEYFERVVFGSAEVEAKQIPGKVRLTPALWYSPVSWLLHQIKVPGHVPAVVINGGSDHLSGPFKSLNGNPVHSVEGEQGENKATLWDLGDGDDWASGVQKKPNYFLLGGGKKDIRGGDADDTVVINADARQTLEQAQQVSETEKEGFSPRQTSLNGGGGRNTLTFSGPLDSTYEEDGDPKTARYSGHVINFKTNTVLIKTTESNADGLKKIAHFQSFSNATTVAKGDSFVQGNDENNLIILKGDNDVAYTGKGANIVVVNGGADIYGEGGFNTYVINKGDQGVTIVDPVESIIRLDYRADQLEGWSVSPSGDLSVNLMGETDRQLQKLVIKNAFPKGANSEQALPTFITSDGTLLTVSASRQGGTLSRFPQVNSMKIVFQAPPN